MPIAALAMALTFTACAQPPADTDVGSTSTAIGPDVVPATCVVYGYDQHEQLSAVDLRVQRSTPIGVRLGFHVAGMAVQPGTNELYALAGRGGPEGADGQLFRVDAESGATALVGDTAQRGASALAFRADGTLWAWVDRGLVRVNPATAAAGVWISS